MKTIFVALVVSLTSIACAIDDNEPNEQSENVQTTQGDLIWKPLPDDWKDCESNGQICRCSGDVVDCRNPRPIPPKKVTAVLAR